MFFFSLFFACQDKEQDSASEDIATVSATLRLLSPINNIPYGEVPVFSDFSQEEVLTEEDGRATVFVEKNAAFVINATFSSTMKHRYLGDSGSEDFSFDALFIDRATVESIYSYLNFPVVSGTGIVAIDFYHDNGVDLRETTAACTNTEYSFVIGPQTHFFPSNQIMTDGKDMIFFANVTTGSQEIEITPPPNIQCYTQSGSVTTNFTIEVYADTIHVLPLRCQ